MNKTDCRRRREGQQGGGVVRALQADGKFKARALTRNPGKHRDLAEEVTEADPCMVRRPVEALVI